MTYELFLDDKGEKISKSKGNGLSIDEWLDYGSSESLSLFMYNNPEEQKDFTLIVFPKAWMIIENYLIIYKIKTISKN